MASGKGTIACVPIRAKVVIIPCRSGRKGGLSCRAVAGRVLRSDIISPIEGARAVALPQSYRITRLLMTINRVVIKVIGIASIGSGVNGNPVSAADVGCLTYEDVAIDLHRRLTGHVFNFHP